MGLVLAAGMTATAIPAAMAQAITKALFELGNEVWHSLAVVCKTLGEAKATYEQLRKYTEIRLVTQDTSEFERGVIIIPSYLAKGLEFDAVLVADVSAPTYHREAERNLFYTVCTRAQHRLMLFYSGELSPFVAAVDPGLYQASDLKPLPSRT